MRYQLICVPSLFAAVLITGCLQPELAQVITSDESGTDEMKTSPEPKIEVELKQEPIDTSEVFSNSKSYREQKNLPKPARLKLLIGDVVDDYCNVSLAEDYPERMLAIRHFRVYRDGRIMLQGYDEEGEFIWVDDRIEKKAKAMPAVPADDVVAVPSGPTECHVHNLKMKTEVGYLPSKPLHITHSRTWILFNDGDGEFPFRRQSQFSEERTPQCDVRASTSYCPKCESGWRPAFEEFKALDEEEQKARWWKAKQAEKD